ncbi:MAG: GNAT family N-acetyltransferase [Clostridia bacterium]|nr:GNAT family N-acetyltransferase [Clostridia bacterium]
MPTFTVEELTLAQIRALYFGRMREDFPPAEIKPLSAIERALTRGEYVCYGAMDGEDILSYAFFIRLREGEKEYALFDYFAVKKEARCMGVGSAFLQTMIAGSLKNMAAVLLEVDDPDCAWDEEERNIRNRRLRFYLRNGLRDTSVTAVVYGVQFRILALPVGTCPSLDDTRHMYADLYRAVMPPKIFASKVLIHGTR